MTAAELAASAGCDVSPPHFLSGEALALWYAKRAGHSAHNADWAAAHDIAQEIHTPMGSWVHALLHLIEGDQWNADYWFSRAGRPSRKSGQIDALWDEIATAVLES